MNEQFNLLRNILLLRSSAGLQTDSEHVRKIVFSAERNLGRVFFDRHEQPYGYVIWARVNNESLRLMLKGWRGPFIESEWSDGFIPVVLDIVIASSHRAAGKAELRKLARSLRVFAFQKREQTKIFVRQSGRHVRLRNRCDLGFTAGINI